MQERLVESDIVIAMSDNPLPRNVIKKHGLLNYNDNGGRLMAFGTSHQLVIGRQFDFDLIGNVPVHLIRSMALPYIVSRRTLKVVASFSRICRDADL